LLKPRLIVALTFQDGVLFRTKKFKADYRYTTNYVDGGADEIFCIDVGQDRAAFWQAVENIADQTFVPIGVGGGLKTVEDVREALLHGADKVVVNTAAVEHPGIVREMAHKFGCQCITVGIDVKGGTCWTHRGTRDTGKRPVDWAVEAVEHGAGEIFLQNVDRDGSLLGYDLETLRAVTAAVAVPVVVGTGCGTWEHMRQGFETGALGCSTAVIHHFAAESITRAKDYLKGNGIELRR